MILQTGRTEKVCIKMYFPNIIPLCFVSYRTTIDNKQQESHKVSHDLWRKKALGILFLGTVKIQFALTGFWSFYSTTGYKTCKCIASLSHRSSLTCLKWAARVIFTTKMWKIKKRKWNVPSCILSFLEGKTEIKTHDKESSLVTTYLKQILL